MTIDEENEWITTTIGEIGNYINGRGFKKTEWATTGLPIIRIQNLTGSTDVWNHFSGEIADKHRVRNGDLLISWAATLGVFIWDRGEAALNQHIFKVESKINKKFHYWVLKSALAELTTKTHGTGMAHITKGVFESTVVRIPKSDVLQQEIAEKLDYVQLKLEKAEQLLDTTKTNFEYYQLSLMRDIFKFEENTE